MSKDTIKLYYYGGENPSVAQRGDAEKVRLFLHECGYPFADIALDAATITSMTQDGTLFQGKLPALQIKVNGEWKTYETGSNIMEVIATKADGEKKQRGQNKYLGEADELPKVRALAILVSELEEIMDFRHGPKEGLEDTIKKYCGWFDDALKWNDDDDVRTDEFTVGKNFTFADISIFAAVDAIACIYGKELIDGFPKLSEFHGKILIMARLSIHLSRRVEQN